MREATGKREKIEEIIRAVASLTAPGWARVPLSSFFLKSRLSFLIFPQTFTHFLPHFEALATPLEIILSCPPRSERLAMALFSKQDIGCFINFSIFTTLFLRFGALKKLTGGCFVI